MKKSIQGWLIISSFVGIQAVAIMTLIGAFIIGTFYTALYIVLSELFEITLQNPQTVMNLFVDTFSYCGIIFSLLFTPLGIVVVFFVWFCEKLMDLFKLY